MEDKDSATVVRPVAILSPVPVLGDAARFVDEEHSRNGEKPSAPSSEHHPSTRVGVLLAGLGVLAFSFSFPATAWALRGLGPWTAVGLRGTIAAGIALVALTRWRAPGPARADWRALAVVAIGCGVGFPLLTTLALQTSTTAHSAVIIGALPMATACLSAWLTRTRLPRLFWLSATAGAVAVIAFALSQHHGRLSIADLYLLLALVLCAAGYAEGGRLAGHLDGWRVIAWGVLLAAPINVGVSAWGLAHEACHVTPLSLAGLAYIAAVSQFLGFVVWYRGMGIVGVARASQLQLAQPLLTLVWAAALMGEHLTVGACITAVVVLTCIVMTQRARR